MSLLNIQSDRKLRQLTIFAINKHARSTKESRLPRGKLASYYFAKYNKSRVASGDFEMFQKPHGKPPTCRSGKLKLKPQEYCAACVSKKAADSCERRKNWFVKQNCEDIILVSSHSAFCEYIVFCLFIQCHHGFRANAREKKLTTVNILRRTMRQQTKLHRQS